MSEQCNLKMKVVQNKDGALETVNNFVEQFRRTISKNLIKRLSYMKIREMFMTFHTESVIVIELRNDFFLIFNHFR